MGTTPRNGIELLDFRSVPTSVDSENNHNDRTQRKYTVNPSSHRTIVISRIAFFIIMASFLLLIVAAALLTFFLMPRCSQAVLDTTPSAIKEVSTQPVNEENDRLPRSIHPTHYSLKIMPFIWEGNFTTNGEVIITLNVTEETNKISLNINDIKILEDRVTVIDADEESSQILTITKHIYETEKQIYSVVLDDNLSPGKIYYFHISFIGYLNDLLQGFYRIAYLDYSKKEIRWLAATQFSPTDARRAFPCFDEPAMKAKFSISLARWKNMTTRSNMQIKEVTPIESMPGWIWDHYQETPIMSTYLVAMMVSDLEPYKYTSPTNNTAKIDFTIFSRREAMDQTRYAGRIGPKVLEYFENYFQISYPLPKMDMVALPDFGFNAMENWGLINFRESSLLYSDKETTIQDKKHIATVLSHELGHQWFGNLVTPEWWDDLWLKEGFATYTEYLGVQHVHPDWNILDEFVIDELHSSFELDCLLSSHPIHVPVQHTSQIRQIFDGISYAKGASIIRMVNHVLGEYTFKVGLIKYLNAKKYGNAYHDDLWKSLTQQAHNDGTLEKNITLEEIMDTWILQTGYPVLNVTRNYSDNSVTITQERFLLTRNISDNTTWWVPVSYTTSRLFDFNNSKPKIWMENEPEIILENIDDDWIYVNVLEAGYYRVNYDYKNWQKLIINLRRLPHLVRAQLIDDAFNLARANMLDYEVPFNALIETFRDPNPQYVALAAAFSGLRYIDNMLARTPAYGKFQLFITQFTRRLYDQLGFVEHPDDSYETKMKRSDVLKWVCAIESTGCIIQARIMFRNWMNNDTENVLPNLKSVVYCTAIREGSELEWNFAYKKYLLTNLATEKHELLTALGCASEHWLLSRYLSFTLTNSSGVRKQDGSIVFQSVAQNRVGFPLAFDFIRNHWKELNDYYGVAFSSISKMVLSLSDYMNTNFELSQLEVFRKEHITDLKTSERAFEQTIERVGYNVDWMKNSYDNVEKWLDNTFRRYRLS